MEGLRSFAELLTWAWLTTVPIDWHERCQVSWYRGSETVSVSPYFASRAEAEVHRRLTIVEGADVSRVTCVERYDYL